MYCESCCPVGQLRYSNGGDCCTPTGLTGDTCTAARCTHVTTRDCELDSGRGTCQIADALNCGAGQTEGGSCHFDCPPGYSLYHGSCVQNSNNTVCTECVTNTCSEVLKPAGSTCGNCNACGGTPPGGCPAGGCGCQTDGSDPECNAWCAAGCPPPPPPPPPQGCTQGQCIDNAITVALPKQFGPQYPGGATCNSNCNLTCKVVPKAEAGATGRSGSMTYYNDTDLFHGNKCNSIIVGALVQPNGFQYDNNTTVTKVNKANNPTVLTVTCTTEENDQPNVLHYLSVTPTVIPGVTFNPQNTNSLAPMVSPDGTAKLEQSVDFIVKFADNSFDNATLNLTFNAKDTVKDIGGTQTFATNNFTATHTQLVDTKPPVLSRTSEFKLPNGNCINGVDCTNLDPNKIIGSGKLQIDYKATDEAGLLSRKIFAGSTNWTNDTQTQFFNEMQNGKALGQNVAQSFDYYHKVGGNNFPLQSESIKINPDGTSNKDFVNLVQDLPQNNALDTLSVVYNLKTPNEPITKPFSFNWGIGGTGANDLNSAWQATDNFCNRISGAQQSSLKVGNPWMSVVGGNTFIQGQTDMTVPQDIIKSADTTGGLKIADSGFVSSYVNRTEDDTFTDTTTQSKYGLTFTNINGESLLHPYKISHGRNTSMYDYYKNIIGTVNRYDEVSEVYCKESDKQNYYKYSGNLLVQTSLDNLDSNVSLDISCQGATARVFDINGNLTIRNNVADLNVQFPTIIFVSGNLIIDASLVSLNNASMLFIVKGDVNIFGGKYSSVGILPGYDQVDASFIVDGVFLTIPDDGEQHTYFGNNYPGANLFPLPANSQVWDGLEINGQVLLTGLCPNDITGGPSYDETGELVSSIYRTDGNDNCVSKFGRDLILVQNFLYPAEKINFNAQYLMDFRNLLRSTPKFKIIETGYDPTK